VKGKGGDGEGSVLPIRILRGLTFTGREKGGMRVGEGRGNERRGGEGIVRAWKFFRNISPRRRSSNNEHLRQIGDQHHKQRHTCTTRMLSPVSCASCSRMHLLGFGVAANADLSISSCLALIVVGGARFFAPPVTQPVAPWLPSASGMLLQSPAAGNQSYNKLHLS